jgi:hypothetical protein
MIMLLALVFALSVSSQESALDQRGEAGFYLREACEIQSSETLSDAQRDCVGTIVRSLLEEGSEEILAPGPYIAVDILQETYEPCENRIWNHLEPAWPNTEDGHPIELEAPLSFVVTFDITDTGRTANISAVVADTHDLPEATISAFEVVTIQAVERWRFYDPRAVSGRSTQMVYRQAD